MLSETIRPRALGTASVHTRAAARSRTGLALMALVVAALVFLVARVDSAAASAPCTPGAGLLAIDASTASCFEGFDGNQVATSPRLDWRSILSTVTSVRDDTGDSTFSGG